MGGGQGSPRPASSQEAWQAEPYILPNPGLLPQSKRPVYSEEGRLFQLLSQPWKEGTWPPPVPSPTPPPPFGPLFPTPSPLCCHVLASPQPGLPEASAGSAPVPSPSFSGHSAQRPQPLYPLSPHLSNWEGIQPMLTTRASPSSWSPVMGSSLLISL